MPPICGIYRITHRKSGRHYVGQSIDIKSRFQDHLKGTGSRKLSKALDKYKSSEFDFVVVLRCSRHELNAAEAYCVRLFNSVHPHGFNLIPGGYQNGTFSSETKKNYSLAAKQRLSTTSGQEALAAARRARWDRPGAKERQAAVMRQINTVHGPPGGKKGVQSIEARQMKAERMRAMNQDPQFKERRDASLVSYRARGRSKVIGAGA